MKHNLKRTAFLGLILLLGFNYAQAQNKKVVIKYQKRQKIDLGELSVEGNVLTPGDISIDYEENEASMELHKRKTYKDKIKLNLDTTM